MDSFWNSVRTEWLWYWNPCFSSWRIYTFLILPSQLSSLWCHTWSFLWQIQHLDDILVCAEFIGLRLIIILLRWLQRTNKHMCALYNSKWWVSFNTEDAPVNQLSLEWWASHVSLNISPLAPSGKGAFSRVTWNTWYWILFQVPENMEFLNYDVRAKSLSKPWWPSGPPTSVAL